MDMIDDKHRNMHAHPRELSGASVAFGAGVGHDIGQNMLVEIFRAIPRMQAQLEHVEASVASTRRHVEAVPRMQAQLEHIEASVESTRRHVEILGRKVENLTSWKHRILGGVAVLAFLWAGLKLLSDYVHIRVGRDAAGSSVIAPVE
ncbi:hypothetical protein SAMN02800694_0520 [Luteibacter sp. UNCMF331Sha3.1]|uniref:hypothetical protein n=1 Tax=Luteibacter sp. UNCMF331Sha3.1 TaxID=1502760 RepID=UPI0008AB8B01|nr:hypothetical protein [Luteibacter sp. UNCMF331Sha3.1]SEM28847.1 hypothetical protein SAMN02800694_0520 [Luteibacter sp. UNCMF331Sha3.1]